MDKRYQVFVSSTYTDLIEERRKAIQALIELGCIPAGMELFPAVDEQQLEYIKKVIDDCDYYLLIIGGRYGSVTTEGISYTEKEFDYAVSKGLKVIALIHGNPGELPFVKSEGEPLLREKLEKFRTKAATDRLVKYWKTADELANMVTVSLVHTMSKYPAVGWIRANQAVSQDSLTETNELRKQIIQLQKLVAESRPALENLAELQDEIELFGTYYSKWTTREEKWKVALTWSQIFGYISPYLVRFPADDTVKTTLTETAFGLTKASVTQGRNLGMDDQIFRTVAVQLKALRLVNIEYTESTTGGYHGLFWSLTPSGERLMMELRTVRKVKALDKMLEQTTEGKNAT